MRQGNLNGQQMLFQISVDRIKGSAHNALHFLHQAAGRAGKNTVILRFQKRYHERLVGQLIESCEGRGSTVENIADFFDLIGWNVEYHAGTDLKFDTIEGFEQSVIDFIDRGIPILVDWVDWAGHWQVIIGIDTCGSDTPYDDVLIFADPYDITDHYQDGYYIFPFSRFYGMWREGPCADKDDPYKQPFVIAYPKDYDKGAARE